MTSHVSLCHGTLKNSRIGMFHNFLCPKLDSLMGPFHHSKVFPATAHQTGTGVSCNRRGGGKALGVLCKADSRLDYKDN
jgi:hypothetical protein